MCVWPDGVVVNMLNSNYECQGSIPWSGEVKMGCLKVRPHGHTPDEQCYHIIRMTSQALKNREFDLATNSGTG